MSVELSDRDLIALRFAVQVARGIERDLEERHPDDPHPITGTRQGEATSDVLAAIVARADAYGHAEEVEVVPAEQLREAVEERDYWQRIATGQGARSTAS